MKLSTQLRSLVASLIVLGSVGLSQTATAMVETAAPFAIPASGTVGYVYAQPVDYGTHAGLDILTDEGLGKTPVYAAYHGTVKHIYTSVISSGDVLATDGRAAFIVLEHTDVTDKNGVDYDRIYTWYLHMAKQGDLAIYLHQS